MEKTHYNCKRDEVRALCACVKLMRVSESMTAGIHGDRGDGNMGEAEEESGRQASLYGPFDH